MSAFFANVYAFGSFCGSHSTKIGVAWRSFYMLCIGMGWTHLTDYQIALVGGFAEAVLAVFIESTTVSTKRMGERLDDVKAQAASGIIVNDNGKP